MICDYPKIYKGELLSSYIYRYHYYTGSKSYRDTAYEIWGDPNKWITSILFPSDTIAIRKQLRLTDEEYIKYHTVFPFYKIFMPEVEWKKVKYEILQGKRVFQKNQLEEYKRSYVNTSFRFCPACIKANNNLLIIKREHQIQGAFSCSTHGCKLETYNFHDRRQRIQFDRMKLFKEAHNNNSKMLSDIANDISFILDHEVEINSEQLSEFLYEKARKEGYLNSRGMINFRKDEEFKNSFFDIPKKYEYILPCVSLNLLIRKQRNGMRQPLQYLILINQLFGSFRNFCMVNKIKCK